MNKIRAAALFCIVIFAIGVLSAQTNPGQMGTPSTQSPQMTPPGQRMPSATPPDQSAPQSSPARMSNIDDQVKVLSDSLNLNADQQSKVRSILMDQHEQAMALIQDNSMAREEKIGKIHNLRATTITKVRELLNADQKTKFDQMVQQQDDRIRQQQGQSGATGNTSPGNSSPSSTSPSTAPNNPPASNPPSGVKPPQ